MLVLQHAWLSLGSDAITVPCRKIKALFTPQLLPSLFITGQFSFLLCKPLFPDFFAAVFLLFLQRLWRFPLFPNGSTLTPHLSFWRTCGFISLNLTLSWTQVSLIPDFNWIFSLMSLFQFLHLHSLGHHSFISRTRNFDKNLFLPWPCSILKSNFNFHFILCLFFSGAEAQTLCMSARCSNWEFLTL